VAAQKIVLDTNIVLDVFVFNDVTAKPLLQALRDGSLHWLATLPMREELERVLTYRNIAQRLNYYQLLAADVLAQFDALATVVSVAPKACVTCKDPDDQKFIDLAVGHQARILSKDQAVLCMKKRLLALSVPVQTALDAVA
jgi:putative PIN family toxin of toxin-antitoxin system